MAPIWSSSFSKRSLSLLSSFVMLSIIHIGNEKGPSFSYFVLRLERKLGKILACTWGYFCCRGPFPRSMPLYLPILFYIAPCDT